MTTFRRIGAAALLCCVALLPACSGSSSTSAPDSGAAPSAAPSAAAEAKDAAGDTAAQVASAPLADRVSASPGATAASTRSVAAKVARRATLDLSVDSVDVAVGRLRVEATAAGGEIVAEQVTSGGEDRRPRADLTVSVPADRLDHTMDTLSRLGEVTARTVTSEDVTTTYVDLDSRTKTLRASIDRVRTLMSRATKVGEIVALESELTSREAELESLTSQLNAVSGRVARSPIKVTVRSTQAAAVDSGPVSFLDGLSSGWTALTAVAVAALAALGWLLPWLIVAAAVAVPILLLVRRRRRRGRRGLPAAPAAGVTPGESPGATTPTGSSADPGPPGHGTLSRGS